MAFNAILKANSASVITVIARLVLQQLLTNCKLTKLLAVGRDLAGLEREKGDTIRILKPAALVTQTKAENAEFDFQSANDEYVEVLLDQHKECSFRVSGPAKMFSRSDVIENYAANAGLALASQLDSMLAALYAYAGRLVGTYGTVLSDADFIELARLFANSNIPDADRNVVLHPDVYAEVSQLDVFTDASKIGTAAPLTQGALGSLRGFQIHQDPRIVTTTNSGGSRWHNLAFHKNAAVLASADMEIPGANSGVDAAVVAVTDSEGQPTGISIRVMLSYDRREDAHLFSADGIFGLKVLRPLAFAELRR